MEKKLKEIKSILGRFKSKKVVVIGDLMLDHYLWGNVHRISPEAPVPIVDICNQEYRLGGAANVVNNIISLKATPVIIGVVGDDNYSDILFKLFKEKKINTDFIIKDKARPSTVKSRIFASGQQVIRYDQEQRQEISEAIEAKVIKNLILALKDADALLIEDYNKGLLTEKIIIKAIQTANEMDIPVTVDPKFKNFFTYKECTVFKPNVIELQKNLNIDIPLHKTLKFSFDSHETENYISSSLFFQSLEDAAQELFERVNPKNLVITLGEKGLVSFDRDLDMIYIPTFAKEVFDVSGAGDTVISALTLCLSIGLDIRAASVIANHAAGAVCGKRGIHPVTIDDILLSMKYHSVIDK